MGDSLIFHIDVNSAYLSWEAVKRLKELDSVDLRTIPSAIGGDREKRHGVILAKSEPAKKYGIITGEPISNALKKCPDLYVAQPDFDLYSKNSNAFMEVLKRYAPVIEQYSIDEAFADLSGTSYLYKDPIALAHEIKDTIKNELMFTVNIGISTNKLLAKMASDFEKPDKVHTLFPDEIKKKMWPLPVGELFFVGNTAKRKLHDLGISSIGDLACCDVNLLRTHLKKQGDIIYQYANGIDSSKVEKEEPDNKAYGNSTTIAYDVTTFEYAKMILLSLCESVAARLREDGVKGSCVTVHYTDHNFISRSHQRTCPSPTNITGEIYAIAFGLFETLWEKQTPLRLIGVQVSKLTTEEIRQYNIFDMDKYEKLGKLDRAIDQIRNKYGNNSIKRACFIDQKQESYGKYPVYTPSDNEFKDGKGKEYRLEK
ncbi:MAG: DNA polymerase IV [Lachnospiraceae bacterium]